MFFQKFLRISLTVVLFAVFTNAGVQLTPDNIKEYTKHGLTFIEHYSPYCGHCRKFAPTWEQLVEEGKTETPTVKFAQVDCSKYGDLCNDNGVRGYPSLCMFRDGKISSRYDGNRDLDDLKEFIRHEVESYEPPLTSLQPQVPFNSVSDYVVSLGNDICEDCDHPTQLTSANFTDFTAQSISVIQYFIPYSQRSKMFASIWKRLVEDSKVEVPHVKFAQVDCSESMALCDGIASYPSLGIIVNGQAIALFEGKRNLDLLKAFVRQYA